MVPVFGKRASNGGWSCHVPQHGTWLTTSGGLERSQAIACVRRALELGITFIDTANVFGRGVSEMVLAEALAGVPRHSYVLATKLYFAMSDVDRGLSGDKDHYRISPANPTRMRDPDATGQMKYWILEVHLVDHDRSFGGFYERLLVPSEYDVAAG
jgi:hypothetical protein